MDPFSVNTGSESQSEPRIEWVTKARCRSKNPDDFFASGEAQKRATVICRGCLVVAECLADALDHHMEWGIWGGLTERQRRALVKEHPEVVSWSDFFAARRNRRKTG